MLTLPYYSPATPPIGISHAVPALCGVVHLGGCLVDAGMLCIQ